MNHARHDAQGSADSFDVKRQVIRSGIHDALSSLVNYRAPTWRISSTPIPRKTTESRTEAATNKGICNVGQSFAGI